MRFSLAPSQQEGVRSQFCDFWDTQPYHFDTLS
jgi:hypothetical protein